jgi:hypothetical protein
MTQRRGFDRQPDRKQQRRRQREMRDRKPPGALRLAALLLASAGLILGAPRAAGAIPLSPGETLEIAFFFSSAPVALTGEVDAVVLDIGMSGASGLEGFSIALLDGAALLGSQTTGVQTLWAFTSPGSGFTLNAVPAELDTVREGSIDGRIRLTPHFADSALAPGVEVTFTNLSVGRGGTPPSGLVDAEPAPTVLPAVVVPEPALLSLLALAALVGPFALPPAAPGRHDLESLPREDPTADSVGA